MSHKPHATNARRAGKAAEKLLGELELAMMRIAWSRPSATVREVLAVLVKKRPLAYTTVMTVMSRLGEKGLLLTEKKGKTYSYRAAQTKAEFESFAAGRVVQALLTDFGGEIALSQFVKHLAHTDPEQLARLAALARQAEADSHDA